jgi:hypothetical protein
MVKCNRFLTESYVQQLIKEPEIHNQPDNEHRRKIKACFLVKIPAVFQLSSFVISCFMHLVKTFSEKMNKRNRLLRRYYQTKFYGGF